MDQLHRLPGLFRHPVGDRRGLFLLSRRPQAAHHPRALQQRADGFRRPLHLSARRRQRRLLVAVVDADAERSRVLRMPPWHGLQRHFVEAGRDRGKHALFRSARRDAGDLAADADQRARGRRRGLGLLLGRILPVGSQRRRHQLPAQLFHRPGGGRRRGHLPQDRVPRAAQPFRLVRLFGEDRRLRYPARGLPRVRGAAGTGREAVAAGASRQFDCPRLVADRLTPRQGEAGRRREQAHPVRARLSREPGRGEIRPAGLADHQQDAGRARRSRNSATSPPPMPPSTGCGPIGTGCSASIRSPRPTST